jgi:hypothetical protein
VIGAFNNSKDITIPKPGTKSRPLGTLTDELFSLCLGDDIGAGVLFDCGVTVFVLGVFELFSCVVFGVSVAVCDCVVGVSVVGVC